MLLSLTRPKIFLKSLFYSLRIRKTKKHLGKFGGHQKFDWDHRFPSSNETTTGFWQHTNNPQWRHNKFPSQPLFPCVSCLPKCRDGHLPIQDILTHWQGTTFQKEMNDSAELWQAKTVEMGPLKATLWHHTCGHCSLAKSILSSLLLTNTMFYIH